MIILLFLIIFILMCIYTSKVNFSNPISFGLWLFMIISFYLAAISTGWMVWMMQGKP